MQRMSHHALNLIVVSANLTRDTETFGKMDPFTVLKYNGHEFKTTVKDSAGKTPVWNESFRIPLGQGYETKLLEFSVWDEDTLSNDLVGEASVPIKDLKLSTLTQVEYTISYKGKAAGKITFKA